MALEMFLQMNQGFAIKLQEENISKRIQTRKGLLVLYIMNLLVMLINLADLLDLMISLQTNLKHLKTLKENLSTKTISLCLSENYLGSMLLMQTSLTDLITKIMFLLKTQFVVLKTIKENIYKQTAHQQPRKHINLLIILTQIPTHLWMQMTNLFNEIKYLQMKKDNFSIKTCNLLPNNCIQIRLMELFLQLYFHWVFVFVAHVFC